MTINTSIEAKHASNMVIINTLVPLFFRVENLKNSPVLKAMKARAISAIKLVPSTKDLGIKLRQ